MVLIARTIAGAAAFALSAFFAAPLLAQAVSAPNGEFSLESGVAGGPGRSSALGVAQGSIAVPIGHLFGAQLDGMTSTAQNAWSGGGALHAFWRDPWVGMAGPVVSMAGSGNGRFSSYGGEAELYAGMFTVGLRGGYQEITSASLAKHHGRIHRCTARVLPHRKPRDVA